MTAHGWAERDRGALAAAAICSMCGRRTYTVVRDFSAKRADERITIVFRCDGCGEPERGCYCPETRI